MTIRELLAQNIARLRLERRLTQDELADKAGVGRGYMSDIERKKRNPSVEKVVAIAEALGVGVDDLLKKNSLPKAKGMPRGRNNPRPK